jgi:hypothetical protein
MGLKGSFGSWRRRVSWAAQTCTTAKKKEEYVTLRNSPELKSFFASNMSRLDTASDWPKREKKTGERTGESGKRKGGQQLNCTQLNPICQAFLELDGNIVAKTYQSHAGRMKARNLSPPYINGGILKNKQEPSITRCNEGRRDVKNLKCRLLWEARI